MNVASRQHQINVVKIWTALEQAGDQVASTRSSILWPSRGSLLPEPGFKDDPIIVTLDRVMTDLALLRDYIWKQA